MNAKEPIKQFQVAAVQMVSTPEPAHNCQTVARLVREAAAAGAQLVLLPEYWPILGRTEHDKLEIAERSGDGPLQNFLADLARECKVWLLGGTLPLVSDQPGKVLNSLMVYAPDGALATRYDKIHLFGFQRGTEKFDEAATIEAARTPVVVDVDGWRIGLSICYDLRFPELYRALAPVDLIVVPSAFTYTTGSAHWEILLRARAIENQCYVLAPAQGGKHPNGRRTWGHSMLIDPWGEIQSVLAEGEGVVAGKLERSRIDEVRRILPALGHRVM